MSNKKKIKAKKANPNQVSTGRKIWNGTKYFAKSWISNETVVDARNKPWYYAIVIGIISVLLAVIPMMTNEFSVKGGEFLNAPSYDYETQLHDFTADMAEKHVELKVENGTISDAGSTKWSEAYPNGYFHTGEKTVSYVKSDAAGENKEVVIEKVQYVDFAVYLNLDGNIEDTAKAVFEGKNPVATLDSENKIVVTTPSKDDKDAANFHINVMFIAKDAFYCYKKDPTTQNPSSLSREFKFDAKNPAGESTYSLTSLLGATEKETTENWVAYMTASHKSIKNKRGWATTGMGVGIYAGLTLLLGVIVFIMTRGKNNPFRHYKFWECQKIAYWSAFAPAVLALALGFLFKNYSLLLFILFSGVRIMWMSMRTLKPYQA